MRTISVENGKIVLELNDEEIYCIHQCVVETLGRMPIDDMPSILGFDKNSVIMIKNALIDGRIMLGKAVKSS